jgi:hypothetical protein
MKLTIKLLTGKTFTIDVDDSATIEEVKQKIEDQEGIAVDNQKLTHPSVIALNNGRTVSDYNFKDGATLHLVLKGVAKVIHKVVVPKNNGRRGSKRKRNHTLNRKNVNGSNNMKQSSRRSRRH